MAAGVKAGMKRKAPGGHKNPPAQTHSTTKAARNVNRRLLLLESIVDDCMKRLDALEERSNPTPIQTGLDSGAETVTDEASDR